MSDAAWQGRRVLVTGASGFLGAHLAHALSERGAEVHGVSRNAQDAPGIIWHQTDLADFDATVALVDKVQPEVIYHLASLVTGSRDGSLILPMVEANLMSTLHLLEAVRDRKLQRFVIAGSQEEPESGEPPTSPYAASKSSATAYVRMYNALYEIPTVHMRTYMIYGPAQKDVVKLVPYVTLEALAGRAPKIGSGSRQLDWVYVDDVVDAYIKAGIVPEAVGQSFEVGTGETHSVGEMAEALTTAADTGVTPEIGAIADRALEVVIAARGEKAKNLLGWTPQVSFEDGVTRTVAWYRDAMARGEIEAGV